MSGGASGYAPIAALTAETEISVGATGSGSVKAPNAAQETPQTTLPTITGIEANIARDNETFFRAVLKALRNAINADLSREIRALRLRSKAF